MATFNKFVSGYWRVQVRRKRQYASKTFRLRAGAGVWAMQAERAVDTGRNVRSHRAGRSITLAIS